MRLRLQARAHASVVREIELLKRLRGHDHIVQLQRSVHVPSAGDPCGGRVYLVMSEHLPHALATLIAESPGAGLPFEQVCRAGCLICHCRCACCATAKRSGPTYTHTHTHNWRAATAKAAVRKRAITHTRAIPHTHTQMRRICRQVLIALRFLHARDIGHHGLSPSNILFTPSYDKAKLSDFASAGLPGDLQETVGGGGSRVPLAVCNAHWYRAPEQCLVGVPVGCEADVWALGCILFEMAAGAPLLPGNSDAEQLTLVERAVGALPARFELGRRAAAVSASASASAGSAEAAGAAGVGRSPFADPPTHEPFRGGSAASMLVHRGVHPDLAAVVTACLEVDPLKRARARELLLMPLFQMQVRVTRVSGGGGEV
jgi:serine/threonine protein kinase